MIEKFEDLNQYLIIAGFRDVKIGDTDKFFKEVRDETRSGCVQFFDAKLIAGSEHLRFAAINALNAFKGNINISSSPAMETLLYASAQNQISNAIKLLGIKPDSRHIAVLIIADSRSSASWILKTISALLPGKRDDSVVELSKAKYKRLKRFYQISNAELKAKTQKKGAEKQALLDLIIEHMALLATKR